jgi:hypothetical protein
MIAAMAKARPNPVRLIRTPGRHRNRVVAVVEGEWVVPVCSFEFVFSSRETIEVYLRWFENYATAHRRQHDIIERHPGERNDIAKLPARLFKASNRPKVIKALRDALREFDRREAAGARGR